MSEQAIQYLRDTTGEPSAVVIPIALWRQIFPEVEISAEQLTEQIEDYCMSRAIEEGRKTPLLNREAAIAFLEENDD